jgi:hypothetical protein
LSLVRRFGAICECADRVISAHPRAPSKPRAAVAACSGRLRVAHVARAFNSEPEEATMAFSQERKLQMLARSHAIDWARGHGMTTGEADAFGFWFVDSYPDPRFRPTYAEAKIRFHAAPRDQ